MGKEKRGVTKHKIFSLTVSESYNEYGPKGFSIFRGNSKSCLEISYMISLNNF